jgi:hypothetical protein
MQRCLRQTDRARNDPRRATFCEVIIALDAHQLPRFGAVANGCIGRAPRAARLGQSP